MDKTIVLSILGRLDDLLRSHRVNYAMATGELVTELQQLPGKEIPAPYVTRLRHLFGGMGSLNDVYITKRNGHRVDDEAEANRRLDELRAALWDEIRE